MSNSKRFALLAAFLASIGAGYLYGLRVSDSEDMRQYLEKFVVEEQIYSYLTGSKDPNNPREPTPVLVGYYWPGQWFSILFVRELQKAAKKYGDKVKFILVNTKNDIEFWRNKENIGHHKDYWTPFWELIFPYENEEEEEEEVDISNAPFLKKMMEEQGLSEEELKAKTRKTNKKERKFQVYHIGSKDRTLEGIEAFLTEYGILKARYDPNAIIEKNMEYNKLIE